MNDQIESQSSPHSQCPPSYFSKRRKALFSILVLSCLGFSSMAQAVCEEGCDLGTENTFLGDDALALATGGLNTAVGSHALSHNTTASANTACGAFALAGNTTGASNTATGDVALTNNTYGGGNTATGTTTLFSNISGMDNTATGSGALECNTTGSDNTASGRFALFSNTSGIFNVAYGSIAMLDNTKGNRNVAMGVNASLINSIGNDNIALGYTALYSNTGSGNIALGSGAGISLTTGSNNIAIGNAGIARESGIVRLGAEGTHTATYIAGIVTSPLADGVAVGISPTGQLGVRPSSARFKEDIKPMDQASAAILSLQPVTFHYHKELDPSGKPQFGLVAEEVEKVDPDLVAHDAKGKPYTVRYEEVNAMLLNEFLKEHRKVESLEKAVAEQRAENAAMRAMFKEQAAQIQRVSAQVATDHFAPRVVSTGE